MSGSVEAAFNDRVDDNTAAVHSLKSPIFTARGPSSTAEQHRAAWVLPSACDDDDSFSLSELVLTLQRVPSLSGRRQIFLVLLNQAAASQTATCKLRHIGRLASAPVCSDPRWPRLSV